MPRSKKSNQDDGQYYGNRGSSKAMRAVIYARYSSHAQNDASIEQQLRVCHAYADDHDLQIVGEYCDHAVTGKTDNRPQFLNLIRDSSKCHFQRVLVYKVDRFARNRYDSAMYKARLKKYGVKVISVMESIPEGPEGILLESILEGSAEYYSANLSQNVMRGMTENAMACKVNSGSLPLGYRKGDDGCYSVVPEEAAIVQEIYQMYADGITAQDIIRSLNSRGVRSKHGSRFGKSSLHTILHNERYTGVYIWRDIRVDGGMPSIISKELFDTVQEKSKKIAKAPASARTDVDYMLTGKLFCGHCLSPMTGDSGTGKSGKKFYYYSCTKRKREKSCDKTPVRKDWIENIVVKEIRERCLTDSAISTIVDAAIRLQEREEDNDILRGFERELSTVKKSIDNLIKAIEQGIITRGTKDRLDELETRRDELELAIAKEQIEHPRLTREQIAFCLDRFRFGDITNPDYMSAFIDVFLSAVYVYDDHLRIVCRYSSDSEPIPFDVATHAEDGVEVFGFESHSSTNAGASEHRRLFVLPRVFVYLLYFQKQP